MDDINKHLEECNPNRKRKIFEDMIIDILSNKKLNPIVTEYSLVVEKLIFVLLLLRSLILLYHKNKF